jgi:class 3 adenylate cyclase/tetratricopeptide (TPR) repeat protein
MARCPNCGADNPEGFRFCGSCGQGLSPAVPHAREVRKTVTVLFCDVSGSTAMGERLDPESMRRVIARYFDVMREAIERHGGTVEKFIGDAVMAVFGIPVVHEDDALRAVRAATDMRESLARLNDELERDWGVRIDSRIGVNTGEVVTGEGDSLATGDAVNVAARLEQGAAPGETLLGESTHRLVRAAITAQPVKPLAAKGKSEPVAAFRLEGLVEGAEFIPRRLDSPLVGRENELAQLQRAFNHAVSERVAYLFTLLGPAGIGKSRLVRELYDRVDATPLAGRCLPYGEGITYWPLGEIESLSTEIDFEANRDEIALQARRILERLARAQPLLVVFDDLQWAEPTFLDLIDHVADLARDAPMLLVCVARPELLDVRPSWGGGKLNATTLLLEALSDVETTQLLDNLLVARMDSTIKDRIANAAEGNPLYVEEMLAMVAESSEGELAVPPTIQALLAARLDRLTADERSVVECAAVEGEEFRREALAVLVPNALGDVLATLLQSLVRKDLIRPSGDEAFRFKHLLLREAAYEALPKEQRAVLHERFAEWLEESGHDVEEILGYHLEQAYRHRVDLGPIDDHAQALARHAASLLASAGRRASGRADTPATISLLERAVRLLPDRDPDAVVLYPDLASAIADGGDLERADELYRAAEELGDEATTLRARLRRIWLYVMRGGRMAEAVGPMEATLADAEQLGNETIIAEALWRRGVLAMWLGDSVKAEELVRTSAERAESLRDAQIAAQAIHWLGMALLWGRTPVAAALEEVRTLRQSSEHLDHRVRAELLVAEGGLLALTGEFEQGRQLASQGREAVLSLGQKVQHAALSMAVAMIELHADDMSAAERVLREAHNTLAGTGERGFLSTISALLALALAKQGRHLEAEVFADESRRIGAEDDQMTQIYWRVAKAHVAAARAEPDEAARLAVKTIKLIEDYGSFDAPIVTLEVAPFLEPDAAKPALEWALAGAMAKGNVVIAARVGEALEALP